MTGNGDSEGGAASRNLHDGVHQRDDPANEHGQPGQQKHDPHRDEDGDDAVVVLCGGIRVKERVTGAAASLPPAPLGPAGSS